MQKLLFKITLSILLIGIAISSLFLYKNFTLPDNDDLGKIEIILKDRESNILSDKEFNFKKEDKLFDILNDNYEIRYDTTIYGIRLLDIDSIKTDFINTYIAIYINDTYSNYGISSISMHNNDIFLFKEEDIHAS